QYGTGILGSAAVGLLADGTAAPMGWVIAVFGIASALSAAWLVGSRAGVAPVPAR
ncbi:Bcr/CflA family drug resistance efflux transporter, partial [Rubrivivax gelatinosus]|nr:Bcr/CflA family drug resistance efflux transporter [Rubrivivax gelatinosus]